MFLAGPWLKGLDGNQDGEVTQAEFKLGFVRWHETWDADKDGRLSEEEMKRGMNREWSPLRGGPPEAPDAANRP
jgi:hypothetical protein